MLLNVKVLLLAVNILQMGVGMGCMGIGVKWGLTESAVFGWGVFGFGFLLLFVNGLGFFACRREHNALLLGFFYLTFGFFVVGLLFAAAVGFFLEPSLLLWVFHQHRRVFQRVFATEQRSRAQLSAQLQVLSQSGFLLSVLNCGALVLAGKILTLPILIKNLLHRLNFGLTLIAAGFFIPFGVFLSQRSVETAGHVLFAYFALGAGALLLGLALIGFIGTKAKSRTLLLLYIIGLISVGLGLVGCGVSSFVFGASLTTEYATNHPINSTGEIACSGQFSGCSNCTVNVICPGVFRNGSTNLWQNCLHPTDKNCDKPGFVVLHQTATSQAFFTRDYDQCRQCPEWTSSEIQTYIRHSLYFLGIISVVLSLFLLVGIVAAFVLRKSLAGYQTDSI